MASIEVLAAELGTTKDSRLRLLTQISLHDGTSLPKIRDAARPLDGNEYLLGDMAAFVVLAEAVLTLQTEVDSLRQQLHDVAAVSTELALSKSKKVA